jgi:hypothetical protein
MANTNGKGAWIINDKINVAALKEYFENDQTALNIIDAQVVEIDGTAYWYDGEHGIATIETVEKEALEAESTAGLKV